MRHPLNVRATSSSLSDAQAFAEIAAGHVGALAAVYDRHHASLYRFFNHATNFAADVDDLVQSTFLTAARASRNFDGRDNARPWLLAIAAGVLSRRRRSLARWARVLKELAQGDRDVASDPQHELMARDELRSVARALNHLSEKKRVALLLADVEGMSCEAIAAALNIPVGTVWTRVYHARAELQHYLARGEYK